MILLNLRRQIRPRCLTIAHDATLNIYLILLCARIHRSPL